MMQGDGPARAVTGTGTQGWGEGVGDKRRTGERMGGCDGSREAVRVVWMQSFQGFLGWGCCLGPTLETIKESKGKEKGWGSWAGSRSNL